MVTRGAVQPTAQLSSEQIVNYTVINCLEITRPFLRLLVNRKLVTINLTVWRFGNYPVKLIMNSIE